jgi:hypothetical protein
MLIDNTAHEKKNKKLINETVGEKHSIFDTILMGGTGSEKMQITECSAFFKATLNSFQEVNYGSIEIRTKGIIIHLNNGRCYHVWCVPFYRLAVYLSGTLNIHAEGHVMKFRLKKNQNKGFIQKLLDKKAVFNEDNHSIR